MVFLKAPCSFVRGFVFIFLYMQDDILMPECAYQYFISDSLDEHQMREMMSLAHIYAENLGPVIMITTENGFDFLTRHNLDEIYIDVIICADAQMVELVIDNLKEQINIAEHQFINSQKNCQENLRILYEKNEVSLDVLNKIEAAIDAEQLKNRI